MSYVCSECQFPTLFPKLYNFNKHCKRFHEEGFTRTSVHPYACDFCRSEPTSEAAWRTHMEVRHVKKMAALRPVLAHIEFGDVVYRHPFRLGCCGVTASGKTHYIMASPQVKISLSFFRVLWHDFSTFFPSTILTLSEAVLTRRSSGRREEAAAASFLLFF